MSSSRGWVVGTIVAVLQRVLPAAIADDAIGDLLEDYDGRRRGWRRFWLVAEALRLTWGLRRSPAAVQSREGRRGGIMLVDVWRRDLHHAARALARARGFSAVALTSLALGIGLATAVFSVVDGVLLQPLPYADPDAIVRIEQIATGRGPAGDAVPRSLLKTWLTATRAVAAFGPYSTLDARIAASDETYVGIKVEVGDGFFDALRMAPRLGRLIGRADGERGSPPVAVLSHGFWQRAFAEDAGVIGRRIVIDDRAAEVIGVLPARFAYPSTDVAIYVPGRWQLPDGPPGMAVAFLGPRIDVIARLRAGATPEMAAREGTELATRNDSSSASRSAPMFRVTPLQDDLVKDVRPALVALTGAVACVLAIVCVNLTNLLLARAIARQREIAIRAALGASRWEMVRPLVLEGLLLAGLGGIAGLGLARLLIGSMPLTATVDPMLAGRVGIDGRTVLFTSLVSAAIGIVVGSLPVWQAPRRQSNATIASSHVQLLPGAAVRAEQLRGGLVIVQVALAMVLAIAATLLSRSLVTLLTVDLGFDPGQALSLQIRLPPAGGATYDWRARFYETFLTNLAANPHVRATGFTTSLPMHETFSQTSFAIEGVPNPDPAAPRRAHREVVTPAYFAAIGLPIVNGRGLQPTDTVTSERVVVINDSFASTFLPDIEPLGRRLMVFGDWHRIVGVVKSKRHSGLRSERRPEIYLPLTQSPPDVVTQSGAGVVLRASTPAALLPFVRATLRHLQPQAAIEQEALLDERIWESTAQPRFYAMAMSVFAVLAVITALVGLFGVLSYIVERRRVEIGVRRALGATTGDIAGLVIGRGLKLLAIAVPIGLIGSAAGVRLLQNLLFGIQPLDAATFVMMSVLIPTVAVGACAWPARRATRIAPLEALRDE
jgi:putative ABC transport system permease protein